MARCAFGGHAISGRYYTYEDGTVVCAQHDRIAPRCDRCGVPSRTRVAFGAFSTCGACAARVRRCASCGEPALSGFTLRDAPEKLYCAACLKKQERCDFCGHPAGAGSKRLPDGRDTCARCRAAMITRPDHLRNLFDQARAAVHRLVGIEARAPVEFRAVSPSEMMSLVGRTWSPTHHLDGRPLGLFLRTGDRRAIHLEIGLPRGMAVTTSSHEYAHAWQSEHCDAAVVPLLAEGFAEWVAHRIAMAAKFRDEARRIEARRDVYGEGFHVVNRLVRKAGSERMIELVKDRLKRYAMI
jgi:hypothetical protein